jgi:hypothetical protein
VIDHEPHVSDLRWDQLLGGTLPPSDRDAAHAHAASCATCAARFRELSAQRVAFVLRPVPGFVSPRRTWRTSWWWSAPLAALAAAAVLVVVVRGQAEPGERTKGGDVKLLLASGHPDALVPVATRDAIHPSDYLQAGYTAKHDGFGAVLSLDGAGAANAYVPSRGDVMVALPAGTERSYPESTLLDAVVGKELVFVLWCETAHPVQPLVRELGATRRLTPPADCVVRETTLDKRARP